MSMIFFFKALYKPAAKDLIHEEPREKKRIIITEPKTEEVTPIPEMPTPVFDEALNLLQRIRAKTDELQVRITERQLQEKQEALRRERIKEEHVRIMMENIRREMRNRQSDYDLQTLIEIEEIASL